MPGIFLAFCAICQRTRHKMCSESDISRSADSVASCPAGTVRVGPGVLWPVSSRPPEGRELAGPYTVAPPGRALPLRAPRRRAVPPRPSPGRALPLQSPTPLHVRPGPATSWPPPQLPPAPNVGQCCVAPLCPSPGRALPLLNLSTPSPLHARPGPATSGFPGAGPGPAPLSRTGPATLIPHPHPTRGQAALRTIATLSGVG